MNEHKRIPVTSRIVLTRGNPNRRAFTDQPARSSLRYFTFSEEGQNYEIDEAEGSLVEDGEPVMLDLASNRLTGLVVNCLQAWSQALGTRENPSFLTGPEADLRHIHFDLKNPVLYNLAYAGFQLFTGVFRYFTKGSRLRSEDERKRLNDRIDRAREVLKQLCLHPSTADVTFQCFQGIVPWDLMYPIEPSINEPVNLQRFLGLAQSIEIDPNYGIYQGGFSRRPISFARHRCNEIKHGIFDELLESYWHENGLILVTRDRWDALKAALIKCDCSENIMYFLSHGKSEFSESSVSSGLDGEIRLSGDRITSSELETILQIAVGNSSERVALPKDPVVYLNACYGGDLRGGSYDSIGRLFLNHGASVVIGPQIRVPQYFAQHFAISFFQRVFSGESSGKITDQLAADSAPRTIGDALLAARREFAAKDNPLGLLYTRYGGKDVFLGQGIQPMRKQQSQTGPDDLVAVV